MKVENSELDAPDRVFVAIQVLTRNGVETLDYRFIAESDEAIEYVTSGWEVYPFVRLGRLIMKDGKIVYA
jgi:hypothetical protein